MNKKLLIPFVVAVAATTSIESAVAACVARNSESFRITEISELPVNSAAALEAATKCVEKSIALNKNPCKCWLACSPAGIVPDNGAALVAQAIESLVIDSTISCPDDSRMSPLSQIFENLPLPLQGTILRSAQNNNKTIKELHDDLGKSVDRRAELFDSSLIPQVGEDRIIGGMPQEYEEYPWAVSIAVKSRTPVSGHFCGGSVIDKHHVLTAAHCFEERGRPLEPSLVQVRYGSEYLGQAGGLTDIEEVCIHKGYNGFSKDNDIAVVK